MTTREIKIPIAMTEVFEEGSPRFVVCRAELPVAAQEAYVDGEMYKLEKEIFAPVGQYLWFPLPKDSKHVRGARCGVFASQVGDDGKVVSRCPLAGEVVGSFRAAPVTIAKKGAVAASFSPDFLVGTKHPVSFKRLDLRVTNGDKKHVTVDAIRVGASSILYGDGAIPLEMATREGAFDKTAVLAAGVALTLALGNRGEEEVTVEGDVVFEEAPQKSAAPKIIAPS